MNYSSKLLHTNAMNQMLGVCIGLFKEQGVLCEIQSPTEISFESTLPRERVKEIFESSSVPLNPSFEEIDNGCRGTAKVLGVSRADE